MWPENAQRRRLSLSNVSEEGGFQSSLIVRRLILPSIAISRSESNDERKQNRLGPFSRSVASTIHFRACLKVHTFASTLRDGESQ